VQRMLDSQVLLAQNLDPTTFGAAVALAVTTAMTASTSTIGTEVSTGISNAMKNVLIPALQAGIPTITAKAPKLSGTATVTKRGTPNNLLTIALELNESITDFISELSKTSGKIPRLGAWNENILPLCVKERYDTACDLNSLLTSELINAPYLYNADDGTTDLTAGGPVIPIEYTSRTFLHPCMSGALIDQDGKLLQPNFDPKGFLKTGSKLQDAHGNLMRAWYRHMPPYEFFHETRSSNYLTCGNGKDDMLPNHCNGIVARWSACLATFMHGPQKLPDNHPAKKTILSMSDGFAMLIPILRDTHPRYAASCALTMNALTQDSGMTIADTFDAFKDYKQIQAIYEGSTYNLEGDTTL
jgi:hypothetical protein